MLKYDSTSGRTSLPRRGSGAPFHTKPTLVDTESNYSTLKPSTVKTPKNNRTKKENKKKTDKQDTPWARQSRKRGGGHAQIMPKSWRGGAGGASVENARGKKGALRGPLLAVAGGVPLAISSHFLIDIACHHPHREFVPL